MLGAVRDRSTAFWLAILGVLVVSSLATGWPAPIGIVFLGAVIGSLISFISIGLVLVYRTNRIINFAQASIGAVAAVLTVLLVAQSGMNYFLGVGIGILTAIALGALIEVSVVRRFFRAPRLILTVATIAVTQILDFVSAILPRAFNLDFITLDFPTPFGAGFRIPDPHGTTSVLFDGNHIVAIAAVPLVAVGLGLFLGRTRVGIAARAAADDAERASLLGVPVKRISTIVWVVAAGLSAIGALLRAPTVGLSITGAAFGPGLLVRALAPAVVGRMENLRTTFVAALVLGIVDQSVFFRAGNPAVTNAILFGVIFAALLAARGRSAERAGDLERSTWDAVREVRPVPRELRGVPEIRHGFRGAAVALLLGLVLFGAVASGYHVGLIALIVIYAIVGVSLVVLTGWAGQISLGQIGFVAVGAAVTGRLVSDLGWHVLLALGAAGAIGAVLAAVIGLPALRIRGLFLAATTVAFALVVSTVVLNRTYFGWLVPEGRVLRPRLFGIDLASDRAFFFFVLAVLLLVLAAAHGLRRSRFGRVLIGARDNELAARAFGVNVTGVRLAAFAISGFFAAIAGGLFAMHQNGVNPNALNVDASLQVFVMVAVGGLGSVPGALIGAAYFFAVRFFLPPIYQALASGLGMVVLLTVVPGGLGQIAYGWRDGYLRWVARRRSIAVPSLATDERADDQVLLPGAAVAGGTP